jgi:hypothetical protein
MLPARESDLQDGRSWLLVRPGWGRNGTLYEGAITRRGAVRGFLKIVLAGWVTVLVIVDTTQAAAVAKKFPHV